MSYSQSNYNIKTITSLYFNINVYIITINITIFNIFPISYFITNTILLSIHYY